MKSYIIIDVVQYIYTGKRMAPTNAESITKIICEGFLSIALGAATFKKYRMELFTEVVDLYSTTRCSWKKYLEVEVFRVEA
jgi:hypothetical protein